MRAIHSGDAGARRDAAHTLKGAARAIGAWQVAEAADRIERQLAEALAPREDALDALTLAAAEARAVISRLDCAA
jgi:HPt (histidine-containing phosphotransfer) domain-containing protein